jgi:hypothetical protein
LWTLQTIPKSRSIPYNRGLKALEDSLAVRRPGDFFLRGALETPMPRVEIDGVEVISFPLLDLQIQEIEAPIAESDVLLVMIVEGVRG